MSRLLTAEYSPSREGGHVRPTAQKFIESGTARVHPERRRHIQRAHRQNQAPTSRAYLANSEAHNPPTPPDEGCDPISQAARTAIPERTRSTSRAHPVPLE